jgi:nitroimidazol reductase NimA-like FMN-containing flavoprotein (pyridoxamine 5'-phosphate oxidase superfamily)
MHNYTLTERTRVVRLPKRGVYERAAIDAILDEALYCHVGFAVDGQPYVIPTIHCRAGDRLYLHGSTASRMLRNLSAGVPVCVTVSLMDGLVLARAAMHHSMNYRSVMVLGQARTVTDPAERLRALEAIVEHVVPGRWREVRGPNELELRATAVLSLPIEEASAKVRTGPPVDDEEDYGLDIWAGVLPLRLISGTPIPDPRLPAGIALAPSIASYPRP